MKGGLESISSTCLCAALTRKDPKSVKRQSSHLCLFALLGSSHIKAAPKMLMKLTPDARKNTGKSSSFKMQFRKINGGKAAKAFLRIGSIGSHGSILILGIVP